MANERVLIVEDEGIVQLHLRRIVEAAGYRVCGVASNGRDAIHRAAAEPPDVVLMDIRIQGPLDGVATAVRLRAEHDAALIFVTAHADDMTLERAVQAMPLGYVVKPFEADDIRVAIATALRQREALRGLPQTPPAAAAAPPGPVEPPPRLLGMVGQSTAFEQLVRQIRAAARGDWTVLIEGETGTGKELVARALHDLGPRAGGPYVPVNCGALTESLAASQLFGHRQGAFTGAVKDHRGFFESAHGGTLFLDEVAELSPAVQASLLRVLEDRTVTALGAAQGKRVDFRLIAASHRNLAAQVEAGQFRQDLLYRLRVARVVLPALRDRVEDIEPLTRHFLVSLSPPGPPGVRDISAAALRRLQAHSWPGNVRELRSAIEYAVIRCTGERLEVEDLPPEVAGTLSSTLSRTLAPPLAAQRAEPPPADLAEALARAGGNRSRAAKLLGISRATLYRRLGESPDGETP